MVKLADTLDLGSNSERNAGSSPVGRTILVPLKRCTPEKPLSLAVFQRSKAKNFKCKTVDAFYPFFTVKGIRTYTKEILR